MASTGERIFADLIELEHKFWNREDYAEEDIPLFSNAVDFIESHYREFLEFFESSSASKGD